MKNLKRIHSLTLLIFLLSLCTLAISRNPTPQEQQKEKRGIGVESASPSPTPVAVVTQNLGGKPEIVLQAGITSPQMEMRFSPDGHLLASVGMSGDTIKLWDLSSGRLLRQLQSSIPSMASSSQTRPFRFSPDGTTIVAFAEGRLLRWEVETGRELSNTFLPSAKGFFLAFLSDDARILAALNMESSAVRFWDTTSGTELRAIEFSENERIDSQSSVAISPDGKFLAALTTNTGISKGQVQEKSQVSIWDIATGKRVQTLKFRDSKIQMGTVDVDQVSGVAFNSDGTWLAVRDKELMKIWDLASGKELKSFAPPGLYSPNTQPGMSNFGNLFVFSPDKQTLALVSNANNVNLVEALSANSPRLIQAHDRNITAIRFSNDGKLLATSAIDNQIKLWETTTGREVRTLKGAAMPISDVAFSHDGKSLVMAGQQAVTLWDLTNGGVRRSLSLSDDFNQTLNMWDHGLSLGASGKLLIAASNSRPVAKVWDTTSGKELRDLTFPENKRLGSVAFSPDGTLLSFLEKKTKKTGPPEPVAVTPAVVAMPDMTKMMEMARKDPKKMQEQMKKVQDAMAKGDMGAGMTLMQQMGMMPGGNNNKPAESLKIIDVGSGNQLQAIPQQNNYLDQMMGDTMLSSSSMSFSRDGRTLASSWGFYAPIVLSDTKSGQELRSVKSSSSMTVSALAWSPDSKRFASAHWSLGINLSDPKAADNFSFEDVSFAIKVWDAETGTELISLPGHKNFVNRLVFSPDGRTLASGSFDSNIKLWDLANRRELRTLSGHTGRITSLDFSPDGKFLVSGSDDGSSRLWDAASGDLLATMVSINQGQDWLVVTPQGLFDGSPGGWNQILWRFSPSLFDVSPVEIFFNEYFYPGLLPDILAGRKPSVPVDISRKDRRQPKLSIESTLPSGGTSTDRSVKVKLTIAEAPAGARDVRLFRNGSLVKVWRGDASPGQSFETTVSLVSGANALTAYAFNRDNVKSSDASLFVNGAESLKRPATFHLLVIGLNEYSNAAYNLKYAAADARAFADEVEKQQRKLGKYSQFEVTSLLDSNATKANLVYALNRLGGATEPAPIPELGKITTAQPEDAVVIFFAGHGTAQQQRFYLIPHDLGYQGKRTELDEVGLRQILTHSLSDLELERELEGIDAGMMLMVIDACNSGQALETEEKRRGPMNSKGLAQLAYEKGVYILTAAQSYQAALEAEQLGHGYLTYALVEEGLKSAAADDSPTDGQVLLREWFDYATNRVPAMQEEKMRASRGIKVELAFVEGEEKKEVDQRTLQRPRVFYRREPEAIPLVVATPPK